MSSTERQYEGDWVIEILSHNLSMEVRTIEAVGAPGLAMKSGDLLELNTGVKYKTIGVASGADAEAILMEPVSLTESLADCRRLCLIGSGKGVGPAGDGVSACVGGSAVVNSSQLSTSESATQKAQALVALTALGIACIAAPTVITQST